MKIGDYIRTKKGIGKIIKCNSIYFILDTDKDNIAHEQDEIIKSSPNIIDLIEVGDYVNGIKIDEIIEKSDKEICYKYIYANEEFDVYTFKKEDIKFIVTKEQFEAMQYKVGE